MRDRRSPHLKTGRAALAALLQFVTGGVLSGQYSEPPAVTANDYSDPETWLCRPGRADECDVDLSTTVIATDGTLTREEWSAAEDPPIDCFYVYPTVSLDPTGNSDMVRGPEEKRVIQQQFARFASQCRPFAPLYRQFTLTALRARRTGETVTADRELGYNDVVDAWSHYLEHGNQGRGVVLIGHSQGAGMLTRLIRNEIEGKPIQERIVSALLLGTTIQVPAGKTVGGTFQHMSLCESAEKTGCIVVYVSFRSTVPPPADSFFGRNRDDTVAACTNPAALSGGEGPLHAYLAARGLSMSAREPRPWVSPGREIDTPFVSVPGLLTAECVANDPFHYLAVTVNGDPADPRVDDIVGDVVIGGEVVPSWGLHLIDVNLAMGNLVDLVGRQAKAYGRLHASPSR